jgi:hypothetical protein
MHMKQKDVYRTLEEAIREANAGSDFINVDGKDHYQEMRAASKEC